MSNKVDHIRSETAFSKYIYNVPLANGAPFPDRFVKQLFEFLSEKDLQSCLLVCRNFWQVREIMLWKRMSPIAKFQEVFKVANSCPCPIAQNKLGYYWQRGKGCAKNSEEAFKYHRLAAEQGYAAAEYSLAYCYQMGLGCEKSLEKAVNFYELAAKKQHPLAQVTLSRILRETDKEKAFEWLKLAAGQGLAIAQNEVGEWFQNGVNGEPNFEEAVRWYQLAVKQKCALAENNLGYSFFYGMGCKKNYGDAVSLFRRAAAKGVINAQINLGHCYENSLGVKRSLTQAIKWYREAAGRGNKFAETKMKEIVNSGDYSDIEHEANSREVEI